MIDNLLEEFIGENEPWLLIGIPIRDSFLVIQYLERHSVSSDQHVEELMPLREGLHVMNTMIHATARCMSSFSIVERIYEDEIHKRTSYVLHVTADMQMKCSEDAIRIEYIRAENNGCFLKTVGESKWPWRATLKNMHRKFGREIG